MKEDERDERSAESVFTAGKLVHEESGSDATFFTDKVMRKPAIAKKCFTCYRKN